MAAPMYGRPGVHTLKWGQMVTMWFTMTEDSSLQTSFVVDDTSVATS